MKRNATAIESLLRAHLDICEILEELDEQRAAELASTFRQSLARIDTALRSKSPIVPQSEIRKGLVQGLFDLDRIISWAPDSVKAKIQAVVDRQKLSSGRKTAVRRALKLGHIEDQDQYCLIQIHIDEVEAFPDRRDTVKKLKELLEQYRGI